MALERKISEIERGIFDIEFNWKEGKIEARTTFKKGIIIVNAITMRIQDAGRRNERCCGGGRLCLVSVHPAGVWPQAGQVNHKSHYASMFSLAASPLSSCPLIRDLSKSPNQIFSYFPLLSSSSFPLFLILKYEMFRFHRLYLKLEISDIFPSRVFEYIQLLGASEGPILRVVDSENWKLGNYKVNGRKGRLGMEPWINSLPTLPRSRFNFRLETRLWIGRKWNSTCAPNIPSSSTKHRPLFVSNFFLRFRIRVGNGTNFPILFVIVKIDDVRTKHSILFILSVKM